MSLPPPKKNVPPKHIYNGVSTYRNGQVLNINVHQSHVEGCYLVRVCMGGELNT